jgi:hypothetical protein
MQITSRDSQRRGESPELRVDSRHLHNNFDQQIILLVEII